MASTTAAHEAPITQLFDEIDDINAGMLAVTGSGQHFQPMGPQSERDTQTIWFFTRNDSDLVQAIGPSARAHFIVIGKEHDYHACMEGPIEVNRDQTRIDKFWNPVIAAWYKDGKEDPALTLLCFRPDDARIWASTDSTLKFGWEIAKANLSDDATPDVGTTVDVTFNR